jgi:hypothetical protein
MTRVLSSATKKYQSKEELSSDLGVSKKLKTIKEEGREFIGAKDGGIQQSDIWNINSILSNIFAFTNYKDLLEFNTVCKKWNQLSNPIIHKTVKLNRSWDIIKNSYDEGLKKRAKIDVDVIECISNNVKHAHFIKKLYYNYKLESQRVIEVFEAFRFICSLTIEHCDMTQDQFLGMINPLTQLQELTLSNMSIKKNVYRKLYNQPVQLSLTLKKLRLDYVELNNNPELFVQTINSHTNLIKFSYISSYDTEFLKPFYKHYSSLVNFEYTNQEQQNSYSIILIIEKNRQITSLKLNLNCWDNELTSYITSHLTNLKEFSIAEYGCYHEEYTDIFLNFSHPTKIKKLSLEWFSISSCSLDAILLNCPELEELALNRFYNYRKPKSEIFINLSKSAKVKKLIINCNNLSDSVVDSLLLSCHHLNELVIILPIGWKEVMKSIYDKCGNLQIIDISITSEMFGQERDAFLQEFWKTEFFTSNTNCKSSLTHLILNQFNAHNSKAEHFKRFESLKSIKYPAQCYTDYSKLGEKIGISMGLWSGYRLVTKDNIFDYDVEFKKILS